MIKKWLIEEQVKNRVLMFPLRVVRNHEVGRSQGPGERKGLMQKDLIIIHNRN
jgi:hypothetical protein